MDVCYICYEEVPSSLEICKCKEYRCHASCQLRMLTSQVNSEGKCPICLSTYTNITFGKTKRKLTQKGTRAIASVFCVLLTLVIFGMEWWLWMTGGFIVNLVICIIFVFTQVFLLYKWGAWLYTNRNVLVQSRREMDIEI